MAYSLSYMMSHHNPNNVKDSTNCEELAELVINEASKKRIEQAYEYGLQIFESLRCNPDQFFKIKNVSKVAMALGITLEGDHFGTNLNFAIWSIESAIYFLCKAIDGDNYEKLYLRNMRMYVIYEYNEVLYRIFADMQRTRKPFNSILGHGVITKIEYDLKMDKMILADGLTLGRNFIFAPIDKVFDNLYVQHHILMTDEQMIKSGERYIEELYDYINNKLLEKMIWY